MQKLLALGLLLFPSLAFGQNAVLQGGTTTVFDLPGYIDTRTVQTGSAMFSQKARGFNPSHFFDNHGLGVCAEDALTTGAYHQICIGHDAAGNATVSVNNLNGAGVTGLNFTINGTTYQFPAALSGIVGPSPSVVGNAAVFNNTIGTLLADAGGPPTPRVPTNTALSALSTVKTSMVLREDFSTGRGAPPLLYKASGVACTLNGGAGDGGAQVPSADSKCWIAQFPSDDYNPQYWGADPTAAIDSTAAFLSAATWIGNNKPGARLNCGGHGNHFLIGSSAAPNTPLFPMTHSVQWYNCFFIAAAMTATTDIWSVSPTLADTDGWGFQYITVYSPLNAALWRNTWRFDDAGNNQKFIRHLKFHDVLVYPSQNRAGADFDVEATDLGTGLLVQSTLGPNVGFFESFTCTHCGDSINFNGLTVATDGLISTAKTCVAFSHATSGAGEFALNDFNCTAYGGMLFTQTDGLHLRGGVLELQSGSLPAPNNSFITLAGSIASSFDHVQIQGAAGVSTLPGALAVDGGSRYINGKFILSNTAVSPYQINAAAAGTTSITDNKTICPNSLTTFTSGTGATYTTPTCNGGLPQLLDISMVGAGGAGFGSGTTPGVANSGTNTVFSTFSAGGGQSSSTTTGGLGGTVSGCTDNLAGQAGGYGNNATNALGGIGGNSSYFGGGGIQVGAATAGAAAIANTGGGGAGAGSGGTAPAGGGGGSGAVCRTLISNPANSYAYTVGAGGAAGTAGTGGFAGGAGANGAIRVTAIWQQQAGP